MKSGIYRILNKVNNHQYIGSAVDIKGRFSTHKNRLKDRNHHSIYLQRAWNKYGSDNFIFEIIENCEKELLIEREQYYFDIENPEYNICKIAGSCLGMKFSKESNIKKSLNHAMRGKFGKENPSSKKIWQYDLNGFFVKIWHGAVEIERELGFDPANIRTSMRNNGTSNGYFWSYKDLGEHYEGVPKRRDRSNTKKPILQYDLDGKFIKEWDSAKDATTFLNKKDGGLSPCLKNINKKAYGYIWKYKKDVLNEEQE